MSVADEAPYWHVPARRHSQLVRDFCQQVNHGEEPRAVPCAARLAGVPNECFANVERHVARFGGASVLGWAIWEVPQVMIEAELHAVWHTTSDEFFDVNPRRELETRITFLPQPTFNYTGDAVDNIREALLDDPRVHAFIDYGKRRYELLKDQPPGLYGIPIELFEQTFPDADRVERDFYHLAIRVRSLKDPCICGRGKRFGDCHAAEFGRV